MKARQFVASSIAVAAAAFAGGAQAADVTGEVFGDFRWSINHFDAKGAPADDASATNNNSHYGIRATTTERGITGFVVYERQLDNDSGAVAELARQGYVGISSAFGTALYGRAATAYKLAGERLDPFFNTGIATISGASNVGAGAAILGPSYGLSALTSETAGNGFINNQIAYTTPSFGGLSFNAAVFLDEGTGPAEDHDYGAGLEYKAAGLTAGVQHLDINSGVAAGSTQNFGAIGIPAAPVPNPAGAQAELTATRLYGSYDANGAWGGSASWEKLDLKGGLADRDYYYAAVWATVIPGTRVALAYGDTNETPFEGSSISVGIFHNVLSNLTAYAVGRSTDVDSDRNVGLTPPVDTTAISLGLNYQFSLSGKGKI
jgi:hypothetical protein